MAEEFYSRPSSMISHGEGARAGRGQVYNLSVKEAEASDEAMTKYEAQYLEREPLKVPPVTVNPNLSCPELINFSLL